MVTDLDRFLACMNYDASDRRPNHELGVWPQTRARWRKENPEAVASFTWDWFTEEPGIQLDRREYVPVNYDFIPPFEHELLEETDEYVVVRSGKGIVSKGLKEGSVDGGRMCMDQYLSFPVVTSEDFAALRTRLDPAAPERYPADMDELVSRWQRRDYPLVLGRNCAANGFYWRAREFMGTEALSCAWYELPELMHEMMEWYADFIIAASRPALEKVHVDYFVFNEDFAMKNGPLLSPAIYQEFIFPHLQRVIECFRGYGVRYIAVDSDGDPTVLIPLMMDAGVDVVWPIERAANVSPQGWRKQFGKSLRLWGGVDKRELTKGRDAIRAHLREFIPLIEEGGFIPTVDHTVPPDVSFDDFRYYMDCKMALLNGDFAALE